MCFVRENQFTPKLPLTRIINGSIHFHKNSCYPSFETRKGILPSQRLWVSHKPCFIAAIPPVGLGYSWALGTILNELTFSFPLHWLDRKLGHSVLVSHKASQACAFKFPKLEISPTESRRVVSTDRSREPCYGGCSLPGLQLPYTTDPIFSLSKVHSVSGVLAQQEYIQTLAY